MNGDISRVTFNPLKHFTSVVLQQGRVQIDADWNEQSSILLHHLRSLAADLIGQHGGPDDLFDNQADRTGMLARNCGFGIIAKRRDTADFFPSGEMLQAEKETLNKTPNNQVPLMITAGHYYVDGLLCENEKSSRYFQQPYRQQANDDELSDLSGVFLLYLDVWERLVTAIEDSSIRDVALGGADTGARTELTWQVRVWPKKLPAAPAAPAATNCNAFNRPWFQLILPELQVQNRGRLSAKARESEPGSEANPCITSPESRYRGMENQLYRVEVHQGGPALNNTGANQDEAATFKWSRDNATVVAALRRKEGDRLIVSGLRDFSRWFAVNDWVEVTHDALELNGLPGTLVRLSRVEGETLTIDPHTTSGTIYQPGTFQGLPITNLKVRRWDQKQPEDGLLKQGALVIQEDEWIELEDGVAIKFEPGPPPTQYRTGDYWLIPARVSTGNVEWPQARVPDPNVPNKFLPDPDDPTKSLMGPEPLPPHGVVHHYAPLAIVTLDNGQPGRVVDLRHRFPPLGVC
jgi:hypothetical protein